MDREKTINQILFKDAADKKWYLSMKPASPKQTLEVQFDGGEAYKFLGTGKVNVGDPVVIDYGGASSYKMGNVINIENGITIKKTHALKPLYTFTTDPEKADIKKNGDAIKEIKEAEELSAYFNDLYLYNNNGRFHIVDCIVCSILNAITVVAFQDLAGATAVNKAKDFLAGEKYVPGFVFGRDYSDSYFAAGSDIPYAADIAETSFTGFYPGWKEDLLSCDVWKSEDLAKIKMSWDEREQAYYLYYKNGTKKLESLFNKSDSFKKMTNELIFRSALSILIRGGFKNLIEAALSVEMPIKDFYDKLIEFAEEIGSNECLEVLKGTDYKNKTFDKTAVSVKKASTSLRSFVIDNNILKKYKGKAEEVTIPDGIKTIEKAVFYDNSNIKKVVMPDSVTTLKEGAFSDCSNLEEVVCGKNLTTLGPFAFSSDYALEYIDLSNTKVKTIKKKCFISSRQLKSIRFSDTLKTIEDYAFNDTAITEYHLPASLEKVSVSAFGRATTDLYLEGTERFDFNSKAIAINCKKEIRIHCKKDSDLWYMLESQLKEIEAANNQRGQFMSKIIPPILVEE